MTNLFLTLFTRLDFLEIKVVPSSFSCFFFSHRTTPDVRRPQRYLTSSPAPAPVDSLWRSEVPLVPWVPHGVSSFLVCGPTLSSSRKSSPFSFVFKASVLCTRTRSSHTFRDIPLSVSPLTVGRTPHTPSWGSSLSTWDKTSGPHRSLSMMVITPLLVNVLGKYFIWDVSTHRILVKPVTVWRIWCHQGILILRRKNDMEETYVCYESSHNFDGCRKSCLCTTCPHIGFSLSSRVNRIHTSSDMADPNPLMRDTTSVLLFYRIPT